VEEHEDQEGRRMAALAMLDAAEGRPLWNTALERDVPLEVCVELATVFAAMAARKADTTPRAVYEGLFKECPSDDLWEKAILPLMDGIAAGEGE
jgi:hypothetical protein